MEEFAIVMIPFLGTSLGAAMVFFLKRERNPGLEKLLLGFAAGVMVAASVWSLLMPSIEMAREQGKNAWMPAALGFLLGIGFLLLLDKVIPQSPAVMHKGRESDFRVPGTVWREKQEENLPPASGMFQRDSGESIREVSMLVLAVALHNLPEGMAVGVALAGAMMRETGITMAGAMALSVGIAIQNLPEGAIISMPLRNVGDSRPKAFWYGVLSGVVEPVGAVATVLLAEQVVPLLPYFLAFAAGAMMYVVADELLPEAKGEDKFGVIGMAAGFVLMMILDVAV